MPVVISDEALKLAGLSERDALIEFACRLYDAGKIPLWPAARLAGLDRSEFEVELMAREIAVFRPTEQDIADDLASIERLRGRP